MRLSVIISTYNQPAWLEKVIWGYSVQTHRDFELIIADDGSSDETRLLIDRLRRQTGLAIEHVWHEDQGFRKCAILNQAAVRASADYLVFTDGDCIPRRDFLFQHARLAAPGYMLSGGAVRLTEDISQRIAIDDVRSGRATSLRWLWRQGLSPRRKQLKLGVGPRIGWLVDRLNATKATWNGGNASTWKANLLAVNGFDERMEYGGEDRELGERLRNLGIRSRGVRYRALCVHLEHPRGYVNEAALARNRQIRDETRRNRCVWTAYGIEKRSAPPANLLAA
jgi:glycosyltransferase involved in cell wall biosynthesis